VEFALDAEAQQVWELVNRRPARTLAGLQELMTRPAPFVE